MTATCNDDTVAACDAVDVSSVAIAFMCEFVLVASLLLSVRSKAIAIIFWVILVLNVVCRLLTVVMVEFIVLVYWVFMVFKSAMAVICVFVIISSASNEVDKPLILEHAPIDVNLLGNVYVSR